MFGSTRRWIFACALLVACGQGRARSNDKAHVAQPPAPPPAPLATEPTASTAAVPAAPPDRTPLGQRLAREASDHPAAVADVDARLEAFASAGLRLSRTRQVLANPLRADYCKSALSEAGLALSVCSFASEADARDGLRRSRASFDALIPGRSLVVNRSTLLTITRPTHAVAERELELLQERFTQPASAERAAL